MGATQLVPVLERLGHGGHGAGDVLAPLVGRPAEDLAALPLPIGPAEVCAERLRAFRDAGAQRLFIRPLGDEVDQLERFAERVVPLAGQAEGKPVPPPARRHPIRNRTRRLAARRGRPAP